MESTECINKKKMHQMQRLQTLIRCPERQAEAIASHYCCHALVAKQLLEAIELAKLHYTHRGFDNCNLTELIAQLTEQLKEGHLRDLGIELKWEVPVETETIHPWNQTVTEITICQTKKLKKIRRIR